MTNFLFYAECVGRCIVIAFTIFSAVVLAIKALVRKAKNGEVITFEDIDKQWLQVKEVAVEEIYKQEQAFANMKSQGIKCGAFKLDSVLKTVDNYCLRNGFDFDKEKVTTFVKEQVEKMKGVK